ncbi:heme-dependent peroxidase [Halobacteriales archaeon QS_8_69_26]|nr:MAG: heme-dependent peroxidase [Halobacteriales archaeon QS_8_69_26]
MERRTPPETEEGWYALHDFRTIDWSAWRSAPERERNRALREGIEYFRTCSEPAEGDSAVFGVLGHEADLLVLHFRPTLNDVDALQRSFERTAFGEFTERTDSFVSVTEASGYNVDLEAALSGESDAGLARYIRSRLEPSIPDANYVSFYPMDKRRDPEQNWYDLPMEERAEHMEAHGDIGRDYAGEVSQIITSAIGFDDWEWGVTLFAEDASRIKRLLYEMRFDQSTSKFAEFGPFRVGQRIPPSDLGPLLAGEPVPSDFEGSADPVAFEDHAEVEAAAADGSAGAHAGAKSHTDEGHHGNDEGDDRGRDGDSEGVDVANSDGIRGELENIGVYAGQPHGEDVYAVVVYSDADGDELFEELRGLRANFDHYDTHVKTAVYEADGDLNAVASVWETDDAADTAGGFLSDLPGVVRQAGDDPDSDTWGTMGMFYTVEPEHGEDFREKFDTVAGVLEGMDGHIRTDLLANREDENDMFIASRWESREDAMAFFRSEEFADTVDWGRDVLADRPRHVFLA